MVILSHFHGLFGLMALPKSLDRIEKQILLGRIASRRKQ
jgi:hypothetical protein